ncbi:MAG: hypothetical protein ABJZ55_10380 [Fuerstiella sp.]
MFQDGSEDYPMLFYLQIRLKGKVDRDIMRIAVAEAFRRHPLLNCHVKKIDGELHWTWSEDDFPEANWDVDQWKTDQPWKKSINLAKETGIRVWAEQFDQHAELTLQYHHACCDGIGASQFLQDIAIGYAREYGRQAGEHDLPELSPLDPTLLATRNAQQGRRVANIPGSILRRIRILFKYSLRYLQQKKVPFKIGTEPINKDTRQSGVAIRQIEFDRKQTRQLRDAAKQHNCTMNDMLVSQLMLFSTKWNEASGERKRSRFSLRQPTACVLVPASLRGPADSELPASNVVSYVFMSRATSMADTPIKLLESIRDEMQLVHSAQAGWFFIQAIEFLKRIPFGLHLMMRSTQSSCMSTTVLSHMGNILNAIGGRLPREGGSIRMGNLVVENIYGVPPIRKGTAVVFSSMMIGGCLKICVRCCDKQYSEADAAQLVSQFKLHLGKLCAERPDVESKKPIPSVVV